MSNAIVSNVYRYVIDDVINQVRGDFEDMGIDDSVLQELQRSWETKVARSRVANFGFKEDGYYDEDGNNNNNNGGGDANALSNNNNNNNVNNNPNGQKAPQLSYPAEYANNNNNNNNPHNNNGPSAASLASLAATTAARPPPPQPYGLPPNMNNNNNNNNNSRPYPDPDHLLNQYQMMQQHKPPHLQQQQQQQQQHQQNNNLPELQLPGLPRPNLPQNDGANDDLDSLSTQQIDQRIEDMIQSSQDDQEEMQISFTASSFSGEPLALDSLPDSVKQLMQEARERAIKAGALKKRSRIAQLDGEGDTPAAAETPSASSTGAPDASANNATTTTSTANDDDINSDLDDTDDEDDDGEGGEEIEHIILCLYDKVTRTKNKWKCILKDGIMLVNGRDYLFHRANGDFEW